jgi:SGNH hydrolase-like domain, acetyltransferase AlgX
MNKTRAIDRLFVTALALVLALPLMQMVFQIINVEAVNEKRVPFTVPDLLPRLKRGDATLAADINRWFDDRYGFRDLFIRAKNQIDYSLFRTSQKVFFGRSDWLFLREHANELVAVERQGIPWRLDVETKLLTIARFLRHQGVFFIVLGVPDKSDAYPAMMSDDMPRRPAVTNFDRLGEELATSGELVYLDTKKILANSHDRRAFYWKTDIHYHFGAARIIVAALVAKIAQLEGVQELPPSRQFIESEYPIFGDIANFIPRFTPIQEMSFQYQNQFLPDQDTPEGHWEKDPRRVDVPGWGPMPLFDFIYRSNSQAAQGKLPTTVLFGNSFSDLFINVGLQTYFKEFYRARNVPERWEKSLRNLPPGTKYVIYQFFAPFLESDMAVPNLMSLAADETSTPSSSKPPASAESAIRPLN